MALGYNTLNAIPYLRDYESAVKWEAATKPVRGDERQRKPLGRRNQKHRHIKLMEDKSVGIFDSHISNSTPLIKFRPNGDIEVFDQGYWCKATYNEVLGEVLSLHVYTEKGKAWVAYDGGTAPLRSLQRKQWIAGKGRVEQDNERIVPSVFRRNERGLLVYVNPPALPTHVVNRKGAKAVRERYAAALGYIEGLTKLRKDNPPDWKEVIRAFPERLDEQQAKNPTYWSARHQVPPVSRSRLFKREHALAISGLMASDDAGEQYRAYLWLTHANNPKVMENVDKVLSWVHRDEWFTEREPIAGKKVHDRYAWAFAD